MQKTLTCTILLLGLAAGCNNRIKPPIQKNTPRVKIFYPWGRIGAQTVSDKYSGTPIVKQILKNSPADRAGLRINDRILSIDGINATAFDIARYIQNKHPGQRVVFRLQRGETLHTMTITVGEYPPLEQITLMCYYAAESGDYVRAHELLRELKQTDSTGNKTDEIGRLERKLSGQSVIPDKMQNTDSLVFHARKAILLNKDRYRAKHIISILEKRIKNKQETGQLDGLINLYHASEGKKK